MQVFNGTVLVTIEFNKREWTAWPWGIAFGDFFFGVIHFKTRGAEHPMQPTPEQGGAKTHVNSDGLVYCNVCGSLLSVVPPRPTRSGGS
jgi:hypothetical protein